MEKKKIILVIGATGAQGGSVANTLLHQNKFRIRVFTRNPDSLEAIALANAGAEIVQGDLNDIQSIRRALTGVYGVFGVTSFWEHYDKEFLHGKNLVAAVSNSNVKHFVLSTLPSYNKLSGGQYRVPHYDMKGTLEQYTRHLHLPFTFVRMSFYYENFLKFLPLDEDLNGNLHFGFPQGDTNFAMVSVNDLGPVVSKIFDHPVEYIGRTVGVVGADRPCAEYAYVMSKALQRNVYYTYVPYEKYVLSGEPGAAELGVMFEVQRRFISNNQLALIESYGLHPAMKTFEQWLGENASQLLRSIKKVEPAIY